MPRPPQIHHTTVLDTPSIPATENISLREFVVDEDAENFNAALWRTIDQNAFILAQRDALEAFNVAKALRLSKETAAAELERRQSVPYTADTLLPSSSPSSTRYQYNGSQPIVIKKAGATSHHHPTPSDEAIPRSFTCSSQVDASQSPSSSTLPTEPIKNSPSSPSHHQDKKAPASIAKQNSRNQLSLSASSFPNPSSSSTAVDSRHSRSTSQSNTFTKAPSLLLPSIPPVGDQRILSKRETGATEELTSSSQYQTSDVTHAKRRRTERKPSISSPSLDVVVAAPPISAPQKSSTFSKNLRPGTIIPATQDNSMSEGSKSRLPPPPKQAPAPKQKAHLHNPFHDLQICPRCGNRLTIPHIQVNSSFFLISSRFFVDCFYLFFYVSFLFVLPVPFLVATLLPCTTVAFYYS